MPTEKQIALANIRALPRLERTKVAAMYLKDNSPEKGRLVRRAFHVSGRQYRKALRSAKALKRISQ